MCQCVNKVTLIGFLGDAPEVRFSPKGKPVGILRHGDLIDGVQCSSAHEQPLSFTEIDCLLVEALQPRMLVPVGKEEEQALHFDTATIEEEFLKAARAQIRKTSDQLVDLMEALAIGQFIEEFQHRSLRRGQDEFPCPLSPRLGNKIGR